MKQLHCSFQSTPGFHCLIDLQSQSKSEEQKMKGQSSCFRREFASFLIKQVEQPSQPLTSNNINSRGQKVGEDNHQQQGTTSARSPRQIVFPSTVVPGEAEVVPSDSCIGLNVDLTLSCGVSLTQEENHGNGNGSGKRGKTPLWNPKIPKKTRSKLSQCTRTPSLIENLISELYKVFSLQRLQKRYVGQGVGESFDRHGEPKYDELFIYQKCNVVYPNEIGLGAMIYSPSVSLQMSNDGEVVDRRKIENYVEGVLADGDCASSCLLFDVPIHGPSDDN